MSWIGIGLQGEVRYRLVRFPNSLESKLHLVISRTEEQNYVTVLFLHLLGLIFTLVLCSERSSLCKSALDDQIWNLEILLTTLTNTDEKCVQQQ